tara:strand:- start:4541 stop:4906 length:366 start_codon:yes stop_codon:yes gene_type:complete
MYSYLFGNNTTQIGQKERNKKVLGSKTKNPIIKKPVDVGDDWMIITADFKGKTFSDLKDIQREEQFEKFDEFIKKEDSKASQRAIDEWSDSGMIISGGPSDEEYLFNNLVNKELKKIKNNN